MPKGRPSGFSQALRRLLGFLLGRLGLALAPHVGGVGPLVGLDVDEAPLAVTHGVELGALRAAMGRSFGRHVSLEFE